MPSRLPLIAPSLAEHLATASPATQAAIARRAGLAVASPLGLDRDPHLGAALTAIRGGQPCPDLDSLHARVDQLDTAALDAADRLNEGTGTDAAYEQAFHRARAATAVAERCAGFADDALYEALQAADDAVFAQLTAPTYDVSHEGPPGVPAHRSAGDDHDH